MDDIAREIKRREAAVMTEIHNKADLTEVEQDYIHSIQINYQKEMFNFLMKVDKGDITATEHRQKSAEIISRTYKSIESVIGAKRTVLLFDATAEEFLEIMMFYTFGK